jgi:hypothetical protein
MKRHSLNFVIIAAIILAGCAADNPAGEIPTALTEAPIVTALPPPPPTDVAEPTVAPTPTPYTPITVTSMVDHANIRSNPGKLFDVISSISQGAQIRVLGKAPGGEWFLIQQENGAQGWIFGQLLETEQDLQAVPVLMPANVMVLEGRIMKENGQPVSGIQFAFEQELTDQILRNDGNSDENGIFLVFMPPDISGNWAVSYVAISCTSNTWDADCNCLDGICGTVSPSAQTITLPQIEPALFNWVYAR